MTLPLFEVTKRCRCGAEWRGPAFTAEPPVREGVCAACIAQSDARLAALTHPVLDRDPPPVVITAPQRPPEWWAD